MIGFLIGRFTGHLSVLHGLCCGHFRTSFKNIWIQVNGYVIFLIQCTNNCCRVPKKNSNIWLQLFTIGLVLIINWLNKDLWTARFAMFEIFLWPGPYRTVWDAFLNQFKPSYTLDTLMENLFIWKEREEKFFDLTFEDRGDLYANDFQTVYVNTFWAAT